jgi:GDP-L-fucose synthase
VTELKDTPNVLVLGHTGFLGSHIFKQLQIENHKVFGVSRSTGHDMRNFNVISEILKTHNPDVIINCAANVGGIAYGLQNRVTIFKDNSQINLNVLELAHQANAKLINPISNCSYPGGLTRYSEENYWNGPVDSSVSSYGNAKRMLVAGTHEYAENFNLKCLNIVFPNLYGPGDHLDPVRAHALGGIVSRMLEAKQNGLASFIVWGTGKPVREWLYIDDAVEAIIRNFDTNVVSSLVNAGSGNGISIYDLTVKIAESVGYKGKLILDESLPDGASVKLMDFKLGQRLLNWSPKISIDEGIPLTVDWFRNNKGKDS